MTLIMNGDYLGNPTGKAMKYIPIPCTKPWNKIKPDFPTLVTLIYAVIKVSNAAITQR